MPAQTETRPCEYCGTPVTKTKTQQSQRTYWTCDRSCANKLRIKLGNTHWQDNPMRGQQDTRPCAVCGVPVTRYLSERNIDVAWTCSRVCNGTRNMADRIAAGTRVQPIKPRKGDESTCVICGNMFYRSPQMLRRGRVTCSKRCADVAKAKPPVIKQCEVCGKELRLKPSQAGIRYCSKICDGIGRTKRPLDREHNGRPARMDDKGYVMVYQPDHPNKSFSGWQYEHRLVVENVIGRYLRTDEAVHHINGVKHDNRPENLEVLSPAEHSKITVRELWEQIERERAELAEYRRRFGPLP